MSPAPRPALDDTRAKLLEAAGQVFAESGFQTATVREICARAGVNIALVNYHFGDKLELYTAVLRHSLGQATNRIMQNAPEPGAAPEEALRELIRVMVERICGERQPGLHVRLMVHELAQPTPAMARVVDEALRPIYDRFRELIGAILDLPAEHDTTRLCTSSVISQVVHYGHSRNVIVRLWPELEFTAERIAQIAAHIADFSLAYMRKK